MTTKPEPQTKENNQFVGRKYIRATGRRKAAVANVKLYVDGSGVFVVNHRPATDYFGHFSFLDIASAPLMQTGKDKQFDINAKVMGGGGKGQSEAVRLAVSRALIKYDDKLKPTLRKLGFLTVDARVKERKKPGLKRARRAPQWAKR